MDEAEGPTCQPTRARPHSPNVVLSNLHQAHSAKETGKPNLGTLETHTDCSSSIAIDWRGQS